MPTVMVTARPLTVTPSPDPADDPVRLQLHAEAAQLQASALLDTRPVMRSWERTPHNR